MQQTTGRIYTNVGTDIFQRERKQIDCDKCKNKGYLNYSRPGYSQSVTHCEDCHDCKVFTKATFLDGKIGVDICRECGKRKAN